MLSFKNLKKKSVLPFLIHWLFWGSYFTLLWSRQIVVTDNGWIAGGASTWGDGAAHLTYMSAFAFRDKFPLQQPVFLGGRFSYPFVADLLGAMLVKLGLPLNVAYSLWGLALSMLLVVMVFWLFKKWFEDALVALVGSAVFFWSGGLGWWWFLKDVGNNGLIKILAALPREYTHMEENSVFWINTISAEFLPQRAFLLGMSVGIGILLLLTRAREKRERRRKYLLIAGILTGLLPIIHPHSLIVITIVSLFWFFCDLFGKNRRRILDWWWFGIPAAGIGGILLFAWVMPVISESLIKWWPGWMSNPESHGENFILFWIKNWGFFWILAIGGFIKLKKNKKKLIIPFIILWIFANLVLFQPWDWDNSKIFTWVYLGLSGAAGMFLVKMWQKKIGWMRVGLVFLFLGTTLAGMLDSIRLLDYNQVSLQLFDNEGVLLAEQVKRHTNPEAIFLTGDQHNHWVPALTGRQILMGYQGWLWSYGFDYTQRDKDVRAMFQGNLAGKMLIDKYEVDYVVIGDYEKERFKVNSEWFEDNYNIAFESDNYLVYRIKNQE